MSRKTLGHAPVKQLLGWCLLATVLLAALPLCTAAAPAPITAVSASGSWNVKIALPQNCTANKQKQGYALQSCIKPCDVTGPSYFFVDVGQHIAVSFSTKPSLVVIGGSQNLQFLNDPVPDMVVHTAPAPSNPISGVTFTGFSFSPREKFFAAFQSGILGKLAARCFAPLIGFLHTAQALIYAFDTSASRGKGLATYSSAACRTTLYIHMASTPLNETVTPSQLFLASPDSDALKTRQAHLTHILGPVLGAALLAAVFVVAALMCCFAERGCCPCSKPRSRGRGISPGKRGSSVGSELARMREV